MENMDACMGVPYRACRFEKVCGMRPASDMPQSCHASSKSSAMYKPRAPTVEESKMAYPR